MSPGKVEGNPIQEHVRKLASPSAHALHSSSYYDKSEWGIGSRRQLACSLRNKPKPMQGQGTKYKHSDTSASNRKMGVLRYQTAGTALSRFFFWLKSRNMNNASIVRTIVSCHGRSFQSNHEVHTGPTVSRSAAWVKTLVCDGQCYDEARRGTMTRCGFFEAHGLAAASHFTGQDRRRTTEVTAWLNVAEERPKILLGVGPGLATLAVIAIYVVRK